MQDKWLNRIIVAFIVAGYLLVLGNLLAYLKNNLRLTDSMIIGYGQLLSGWIFLPIAIILLAFALREFGRSNVRPVLHLEWQGDNEDGDWLVVDGRSNTTHTLNLDVRNEGEAVVVWYRITVELPQELVALGEDIVGFEWAIGSRENGNYSQTAEEDVIIHDFKSNGRPALYPDEQTHVATLRFTNHEGNGRSWQGKIRCYIVTDKTRIVHKEQKVRLEI